MKTIFIGLILLTMISIQKHQVLKNEISVIKKEKKSKIKKQKQRKQKEKQKKQKNKKSIAQRKLGFSDFLNSKAGLGVFITLFILFLILVAGVSIFLNHKEYKKFVSKTSQKKLKSSRLERKLKKPKDFYRMLNEDSDILAVFSEQKKQIFDFLIEHNYDFKKRDIHKVLMPLVQLFCSQKLGIDEETFGLFKPYAIKLARTVFSDQKMMAQIDSEIQKEEEDNKKSGNH